MTEREKELIDIILTQRKLLCYLALEYKGERMLLNAEGFSALQFWRDFYDINTVDQYLIETNKWLEERYGEI